MTQVPFIVLALNMRSQVLTVKDRRNGVGKPVFRLAPFGNGQVFDLLAPGLCIPSILDDVVRQVIVQARHLAQNGTLNGRSIASSPFRRLASRGHFFSRFPCVVESRSF